MKTIKIILWSLFIITIVSCEKSILLISNEKAAQFVVNGNIATVNGVLGKIAHKRFEKMLATHPEVNTLVLENVPGSMNDEYNVQTCELLHNKGFSTKAMSYSEIASGGVDLLISGTNRIIETGAKIGVHSWSSGDKEGIEYPASSKEHQLFYDLFETIGMDTAFYWFTLRAAPADSIHWMTEDEIALYQLSSE
ncbi:MAG: alpha/beta hydrolase [Bacteroidetes bacterium]|nr:alpha/beta hydrolase [Bacteroidota bacterium]